MLNIRLVVLCALLALSATAIDQTVGDAVVEEEDAETLSDETTSAKKGSDSDDEDDTGELRPSPNAVTTFLFVEPPNSDELIGGKVARMLVGFENVGNDDFVVESVGATLRYPGDYNYVIHNYTAHKMAYLVRPSSEATFDYAFMPFETFAGRPFVLVMNVNYKQSTGKQYSTAVYNGTVFIHEDVSGFDAETLFLYVLVISFALLSVVLLYRFLMSKKRKLGLVSKKAPVELGTSNMADVDLDWIPKSALLLNSNATRTPRQRKGGRAKTAGEG